MLRRALGIAAVFVVAACAGAAEDLSVGRAPVEGGTPPTLPAVTEPTTQAPTTVPAPDPGVVQVPSTAPVPSSTAPSTTVAAAPAPLSAPAQVAGRAASWTKAPYEGFGAWLDAFDWSVTFARSPDHVVGLDAIDHMAAEGVQTLYIQASRWNSPTDVLEPERLIPLIDRAHANGMSVVAWYLPTLVDPEVDLRRMLTLASLDIDGLGVDIEARDVEDVAERNRRLIDLSARLDEAMGDRTLAAIVMEPVIMEDVNPRYWPDYPWMGLSPHYDVWMPMSYWTNRRGGWRDSYAYTATNIARVRERIGQPDAFVHTIGGIGDKTSVADLHGMVAAAVDHGARGGSIYDYRTTHPALWDALRAFRSGS